MQCSYLLLAHPTNNIQCIFVFSPGGSALHLRVPPCSGQDVVHGEQVQRPRAGPRHPRPRHLQLQGRGEDLLHRANRLLSTYAVDIYNLYGC